MVLIITCEGINDLADRGKDAAIVNDAMICCQFLGGQGENESLEVFHGGFELRKEFLF